jgi:type IV secretory pathway component VirB8
MIESGIYFEESQKWYNDIYLSSFISRIAYFVFFITYGISIYFAITFAFGLFPLKETKDMIIKTSRDADTYVNKIHLTEFDTPSKNILSIILKNYVTQREQYILDNKKAFDVLKQKNEFIRKYSSQRVFADFKEELNVVNGKADRLMAGNIETKISIINFNFIIDDESFIEHFVNQFIPTGPPKNAKIEFISNGQHKVATISYIFDLPSSNAKGKDAQIMLNVIEYNVTRTN